MRTMPSANGIRELVINTFMSPSWFKPQRKEQTPARAAAVTESLDTPCRPPWHEDFGPDVVATTAPFDVLLGAHDAPWPRPWHSEYCGFEYAGLTAVGCPINGGSDLGIC
ncbi:hypothetical protein MSEO_37310 [Mycobacterium seoulense]|uniref:Uncharacterized protein n=1 Tax=Mycobacterium seoulense TaxID=386911 RepID=A0A7I7P5D9_9MYCO|nr:hypothetical protein MSEO_37310 [Mycobacterium seoulense]